MVRVQTNFSAETIGFDLSKVEGLFGWLLVEIVGLPARPVYFVHQLLPLLSHKMTLRGTLD